MTWRPLIVLNSEMITRRLQIPGLTVEKGKPILYSLVGSLSPRFVHYTFNDEIRQCSSVFPLLSNPPALLHAAAPTANICGSNHTPNGTY